jgi:hypothetical protein
MRMSGICGLYSNHAVDISCRESHSQPQTHVIEKAFAISTDQGLYNTPIEFRDIYAVIYRNDKVWWHSIN